MYTRYRASLEIGRSPPDHLEQYSEDWEQRSIGSTRDSTRAPRQETSYGGLAQTVGIAMSLIISAAVWVILGYVISYSC
jgi:hypothetical protein